jgi:hypothetical protein
VSTYFSTLNTFLGGVSRFFKSFHAPIIFYSTLIRAGLAPGQECLFAMSILTTKVSNASRIARSASTIEDLANSSLYDDWIISATTLLADSTPVTYIMQPLKAGGLVLTRVSQLLAPGSRMPVFASQKLGRFDSPYDACKFARIDCDDYQLTWKISDLIEFIVPRFA